MKLIFPFSVRLNDISRETATASRCSQFGALIYYFILIIPQYLCHEPVLNTTHCQCVGAEDDAFLPFIICALEVNFLAEIGIKWRSYNLLFLLILSVSSHQDHARD